jgi:hypothetical protein
MAGSEINRKDLITDEALHAPLDLAKNLQVAIDALEKLIGLVKGLGGDAKKAANFGDAEKSVKGLISAQAELDKINKQILIAEAKNNEEYATKVKRLSEVKEELKKKTQEDIKSTQAVNAQNSSLKTLDEALKRNRAAYAALTGEEARNSAEGKKLLATIQNQDKASKELSKSLGQAQKNVGNYGEAFQTLAPGLSSASQGVQGFGKALLALAANPIILILSAIVAGIAVLGKAVSIFFTDTLEGQEKLNKLTAVYDGVFSTIKNNLKDVGGSIVKAFEDPGQAIKDFGQLILDNILNRFKGTVLVYTTGFEVIKKLFKGQDTKQALLDFGDAFIQIATGIADATGKLQKFDEQVRRNTAIANALRELQNALVKEHIKDVVDDANTELQVNELLEKSKNKLLYTDKQRLEYLDSAIGLLKEQVKGDIQLAQADLIAAEQKIRLNGGVIQQNKLISEYTNDQLLALRVNAEGVKELANLQVALLKVESDAAAKQKGFTKLRTAAVLEIQKAERDRIERGIVAQNNYDKAILNATVSANDAILKDDNASLLEREEALNKSIQAKAELYRIDQENALRALKNGIRDRLIADGGDSVSDSRIEADKSYQKEKLAIEESFADKDRQLTVDLMAAIKGIYAKGYTEINAQVKKSTDDQIAILNDQYLKDDSTIGFKEYEDRKKQIQEDGQTGLIQSQLAFLKTSINHLKSNNQDVTALEEKLHDAEIALSNDSARAKLENDKKVYEERVKIEQALIALQNQAFQTAQDINANIAQGKTQKLDKELKDFQDAQETKLAIVKANEDAQIALAGDNAEKKAAIQLQSQAAQDKINRDSDRREKVIQLEKARIQARQARYEKALALTQAIVNTAEAVTKALPNVYLAALAGAAGALQIASIASRPIPQYFKGTDNAPGGLALVGEKGTELIRNPRGQMMLTPSSTTLMDLEKGSKVFTHEETVKMLGMGTLAKAPRTIQKQDTSKELLNEMRHLVAVSKQNRPVTIDYVRVGSDIFEVKKERENFTRMMKSRSLGKWVK